jgi:hypothetical protein
MIHEPSSAAPKKAVFLTVELQPDMALALAQFCKRVCWAEIRGCSVDDDEAYEIRDSLGRIREALQLRGYAPR